MGEEGVEIAGCCDVDLLELVATGGVCLSKTEDTTERVAPKQWQKIVVAIYAIGNVLLGIFELVVEGLALNEVTSPIADFPITTTAETWQPNVGITDGMLE